MTSETFVISGTSPAAEGTAVSSQVSGLLHFNWFAIYADLIGATGGTLNIYLQRRLADNVWADFVRFPELLAGAAATRTALTAGQGSLGGQFLRTVGIGTDAVPAPAFDPTFPTGAPPAGMMSGHPGDVLRAAYVAGVDTTAGAAVKIYIVGSL